MARRLISVNRSNIDIDLLGRGGQERQTYPLWAPRLDVKTTLPLVKPLVRCSLDSLAVGRVILCPVFISGCSCLSLPRVYLGLVLRKYCPASIRFGSFFLGHFRNRQLYRHNSTLTFEVALELLKFKC